MNIRLEEQNKAHFSSYLIALGTVLLFTGSGAALGIADNYLFFFLAIFYNLAESIFRKRFSIKLRIGNVFLILVVILTLCYMIAGNYDKGSALSMIMYAVLFLSIELVGYNESDSIVIIVGAIASSVIFSALILFFGHEYLYRGTAKFTYTQTFGSHITFEPNYLGTIIVLGFCLSTYLGMQQGISIKQRLLFYFMAIVDLIGVMLTGSRSALVAVLTFGVTLVFTMKPGRVKRRLVILIILLILFLLIIITIGVVPESVYLRMFRVSYVDNSNMKRLSDWSHGLRSMFNSWLLGHGPNLTMDVLIEEFGFHGDVHNTFLTIGVMFGLVPFLLFVIWIIRLGLKLYISKNRILFAVYIAMVFEWNILPCLYSVATWLMLIIAMIIPNREIKQQRINEI